MDKFVQDAFNQAKDAFLIDNGYQAFKRISGTIPWRFLKTCDMVGHEKCKAIIDLVMDNGLGDAFTHIWYNMFMSGFVAGYRSCKEDEENKK